MASAVETDALVEVFSDYSELLRAVGHSADPTALVDFLAEDEAQKEAVRKALGEDGEEHAAPPEGAVVELQRLGDDLREELCGLLEEQGVEDPPPEDAEALRARLAEQPDDVLDAVADRLLLGEHARFIQRRYMDAGRLRAILRQREDDGDFALVKLVPFLRRELKRRGYAVGPRELQDFFAEESEARGVPYCLGHIVRGLNGEFRKGLISFEELTGDRDPDEWLEEARQKLLFRSHSAMHKAIAQATSLKYDCIHKALSGKKKARRIQAEIKYCLNRWLRAIREDREPDIPDEHRGVPVEWTCTLMPELEEQFDTKEEIYRRISDETGVKKGSVRRYFQQNGQLKYAPLSVYRCARQMTDEQATPRSYLLDRQTCRVAWQLARKAKEARRRWRMGGDEPELELEFRETRRMLIAAMKEGWQEVPSTA